MIGEDWFCMSRSLKPRIHPLKERKKYLFKHEPVYFCYYTWALYGGEELFPDFPLFICQSPENSYLYPILKFRFLPVRKTSSSLENGHFDTFFAHLHFPPKTTLYPW
jgi:hypothetical protein